MRNLAHGCIVARRDLDTIRLQLDILADIVLRMAGSILEFDTVQKIQVLSDAETCLKNHIHNASPTPAQFQLCLEPQFHILSNLNNIGLYRRWGHLSLSSKRTCEQ